MSRWLPYLAELQPEMFCEVSPELAAERGLVSDGWATIVSPRGGRTVHQTGLPYHWGVGIDAVVSGDAANDLLGVTLDPNVQIQESKAGSCDIRAGRRPRGDELLRLVAEYQALPGVTIETDNVRITDPAREIVEPPPEHDGPGRHDDPGKEGRTQW